MLLVGMILLSLCACSEKHYDESNVHELYDRQWIIGRSRADIEARYGEFHREYLSDEGEAMGAYYLNYDNGFLDPSYIHDTYFVVFGDDGLATDAYFRETSIGG